eukprot:scaffold150921_cov40-Cyclotella_meneghiniana.AAC.2
MKRSRSDSNLPSEPREDIDLPYPWLDCQKPCYGFTDETKDALLSSSTVDAKYVLRFTLDFVFGWYPYYDALERHGNMSLDDRLILSDFVTEWLAVEEEFSMIPSLKTLCAQRIAMDIFRKLVFEIDENFDYREMSYFAITIFYNITMELSKINAPVHLYPLVVEEVCIFVTVYLLYIDVRKLLHRPTCRNELKLPTPKEPNDSFYWWSDTGWRSVESVVENSGRGSLAKLSLLPYSAFVKTKIHGSGWSIELVDSMLNSDGSLKIQHPMGESVALAPIISWLVAVFIRSPNGDTEWAREEFEEFVIPWLRNMQIKPVHKDPDELYDFMIKVSNMTGSPKDVHALEPLTTDKSRDQELIQNCIDLADTVSGNCIDKTAYNKSNYPPNSSPGYEDSIIKRIRLNGAYSKAEILQIAMRFNGSRPATLDFEDCKNLDEKCLKLVLHKWLYRPKVLHLAGTSIRAN